MTNNKVTNLACQIQDSLKGMYIQDINIKDIRTIKSDLQIVKEKIDELEKVVDAYILVLE
jgi:hypothetical protein